MDGVFNKLWEFQWINIKLLINSEVYMYIEGWDRKGQVSSCYGYFWQLFNICRRTWQAHTKIEYKTLKKEKRTPNFF